MSRLSLADISKMPAAIQAQVAAQLEAFKLPPVSKQAPSVDSPLSPVKTPKNRIRQNSTGLNRTEQAFKDFLGSHPSEVILSQAITLRLGNGVRYTPDFIKIESHKIEEDGSDAQKLTAYEVKGFMRDDAAVKLKVAASLYPWIEFHLVTRKKGVWQFQEIIP